jgi:ferredoxin
MAMLIVESCISCAACEEPCPNHAITPGDSIFLIDPEKCTECVGAFDAPQCVEVCPVEGAIVPDPERRESREQLTERYQRLHA